MEEPPQRTLPSLPREILEMVFHHLSVFQLKRARLVCRTWNEIICGSKTLWDRFVFVINHSGNCVQTCLKCQTLRNARDRLRIVHIRDVLLDNWSLVSTHLQRLELECCYGFKMDYIINIFKNLQNLQSLKLITFFMDDFELPNVKLDFKQENLKELSIVNSQLPVNCLYVIKKICVNLEILEIKDGFHWSSYNSYCDEQLVKLIFALRNNLKHLILRHRNIQGYLLEEICSIDRLELKTFSLQSCDKLKDHHIVRLSRMQPCLERLEVQSMTFSNEQILVETCHNLANMKSIKLETIQPCGTSWLSYLPHLVHLELNSGGSELNLGEATFPNLKILSLKEMEFPPGSPSILFRKLPNLHKLSLSSCKFQQVPDLLSSLHYLKHLQFLKLDTVQNYVDRFPKQVPHKLSNLHHLELINITPNNPLLLLTQRSPRLVSIHLENINTVDRQLRLVCRSLKHLVKLSLQELPNVTGGFVEFVCVHRGALETIKYVHCPRIRYREKNRMNYLRLGKVDVSY